MTDKFFEKVVLPFFGFIIGTSIVMGFVALCTMVTLIMVEAIRGFN